MNKIYPALQLMRLYRLADEQRDVDTPDIVERSAQAFVNLFVQRYSSITRPVFVFAGYADNGAISLAIARLLGNRRMPVQVYLFYNQGTVSDACEAQRIRCEQSGIPLQTITTQFTPPQISEDAIIIDGLFGAEATHGLEGGFVNLVKWINSLGVEIVSVDLPSGLLADSNVGRERAKAIRASRTITFDSPRLCMLMAENAPYLGEWEITSLGLSQNLHEQVASTYFYQSELSLAQSLLHRDPFSRKENYGTGLIIGGDPGLYGQLLLSVESALLTGLGELHVSCPESGHIPLTISSPEAILHINPTHKRNIPEQLRSYRAIAIGTAMRDDAITEDELRNIFSSYRNPIVLDGSPLEIIAEHQSLLDVIPQGSILLLNDAAKKSLLGLEFSDMDYIEAAQQLATSRDLTVVLKGTYTTICRASGNVYFNLKGSPGMASNGMGDILTGLIVGFLSRGYDTLTAVLIACYLHGTAGDYIAARTTEETLSARQIIKIIPEIFRLLYV